MLQQRFAFEILLEEIAIVVLAEAAAALRDGGDPDVSQIEHQIRFHRVGILKQRAIMGAAGIEV